MNRRNVLGNRIEESKTLWVILAGILVTAVQFMIYRFVSEGWLGILLAGLCMLVGSVIIHFVTKEQEELLGFLLIPCVFSGAMGLLIPVSQIPFFPQSNTALYGCLFAWVIPIVYAVIYTWVMGSTEASAFAKLYIRAVVFFYLVYFGLMIYGIFFRGRVPELQGQAQMVPCATFTAYIDAIVRKTGTVSDVIRFLAERVVFFVPYGFFIGMVCRNLHGLLRFVLLIVLPALIELVQFTFGFVACDIDDFIFCFLGALIGMVSFFVFDSLFQYFVGRHFDGTEIDRDYYGRKI